jgi:hypothetical protein
VPVVKAILAVAESVLQERALLKTRLAAAVGDEHEGAHECCRRAQKLEEDVTRLETELQELRALFAAGA